MRSRRLRPSSICPSTGRKERGSSLEDQQLQGDQEFRRGEKADIVFFKFFYVDVMRDLDIQRYSAVTKQRLNSCRADFSFDGHCTVACFPYQEWILRGQIRWLRFLALPSRPGRCVALLKTGFRNGAKRSESAEIIGKKRVLHGIAWLSLPFFARHIMLHVEPARIFLKLR